VIVGLTIHELVSETGIPARTIRWYIQRGLMPRPALRGPATVYASAHLHFLRDVAKARDERTYLVDLAERHAAAFGCRV